MENRYDEATGQWITSGGRYEAIEGQAKYDGLGMMEPLAAWPLLLELVDEVPDDLLVYVGSGPLEELVCWHGEILADRIEERSAADPRFRSALFEINLERGRLPAEVEARIVRAAGPRFELLPPYDDTDDP